MSSIYEPIDSIPQLYRIDFHLVPELWNKFNEKGFEGIESIDFSKWKCEKLFSSSDCFSEELSNIPTDCGGLYVYVIENRLIPSIGKYIMYIGKASKTEYQNLRKRVKSYSKYINDIDRPKIHNLFEKWGNYLYVYYLPIYQSNEDIDLLEERLISCIIPPCNADIRDAAVQNRVKAF